MLRVGLVGCGFIGRVHSFALKALVKGGLVDAKVAVTYDASPGRATELARHHDAEVADDLDVMLDAADVVYVCTPTASHLDLVERATTRGLAVFCEKPLAPDLDGARRVGAALGGVPHQVGLVLRQGPVLRRIEELLTSGRFGRTMTMVLRDDQFFPNQGHYASTWRAEVAMAGGGTLIEHSIHDLDVLRWLCGDPERVTAHTAAFFEHPGIEDLATVQLAYPDGRSATLVSVWHQVLSRPSTRMLEVFCERAYLRTDDEFYGPLVLTSEDGTEEVACDPPGWVDELPVPEAVRRPIGPYAAASRHFLEAVAAGSSGAPGAAEAVAAHELVDAAYRSAASGGAPVPA